MDKKYIEENEIEIKYLRHQLSEQELEEFEVYLMENPGALETLEFDLLLVKDSGNTKLNSVVRSVWFTRLFELTRFRKIHIALGIAAISAISIKAFFPSSGDAYLQELSALRNGNISEYLIELPQNDFRFVSTKKIKLKKYVDHALGKRYQAEVRVGSSGDKIFSEIVEVKSLSGRGAVELVLSAKDFPPDSYILTLGPISNKANSSSYRLIIEAYQ